MVLVRDSISGIESEVGFVRRSNINEVNNHRRRAMEETGRNRHEDDDSPESGDDLLLLEDKWDFTIARSFDNPREDLVPVELSSGSTYYFDRDELQKALEASMSPDELLALRLERN